MLHDHEQLSQCVVHCILVVKGLVGTQVAVDVTLPGQAQLVEQVANLTGGGQGAGHGQEDSEWGQGERAGGAGRLSAAG